MDYRSNEYATQFHTLSINVLKIYYNYITLYTLKELPIPKFKAHYLNTAFLHQNLDTSVLPLN